MMYLIFFQARAWLLNIGFSLAFGAMFIKTWRVYKIYTNIHMRVGVSVSNFKIASKKKLKKYIGTKQLLDSVSYDLKNWADLVILQILISFNQ